MKKRKLILALYIGVIALAVASVSISVAWFVANRNLYVNSINITIDTDIDLQISTSKDDGYVEHIDHTQDDLSVQFMPLTSAHSSLWTSERKDSPIFYDESGSSELDNYITYRAVDEGYGYFTQKYYLLADSDVFIKVNPDNEKTYITANEEYNPSYASELATEFKTLKEKYDKAVQDAEDHPDDSTYAVELQNATTKLNSKLEHARYITYAELDLEEEELASIILERLNKVVNAMRFSILIKDGEEYSYTIIDPNKEGTTLLGGVLDNDVDSYYDAYLKTDTNEWCERVYGEVSGEPVYEEAGVAPKDEWFDSTKPYSAFNAYHNPTVKTLKFDEQASLDNGFVIKSEPSLGLDELSNFHFPVYMDTPKEVIVSIYLEGWDLDSVNYTMKATFNAGLSFMIERKM